MSTKYHEGKIVEVIEHALKHQLCNVGQLYEKLYDMFDDKRNVVIDVPQGFIKAVDGKSFIENYLPHPAKLQADEQQQRLIEKTSALNYGGMKG